MNYYLKYMLKTVIFFFIMTILIFITVRLMPASPVDMLLQHLSLPPTEANRRELIVEYGLDKNIVSQYGIWMKHILSGSFGNSLLSNTSIGEEMMRRLPYSFGLGMGSLVLSIILSFFLGYGASLKKNGFIDVFTRFLSIFTLSFPSFIVALIIIYVFSIKIPLFKFYSGNPFWGLFFATLLLVFYQSANLTRVARTAFVTMQEKTYVKAYLMRGFPLSYVLLHHCYKPVLYSILSASISKFSTVIGGSVVLEFAFFIPGISYFLISSIMSRDYTVIQAYLVILFIWMYLVHFIVDLLLRFLKGRDA